MSIKVIAFEVDDTLWSGRLDERKWGKGPTAYPTVQDNIEMVDDRRVRDKSNYQNFVTLYPDVPGIVHDIVKRGIKLAIVSSNTSKALCDRALHFFTSQDASGNSKSIISLIDFDEVGQDGKVKSFTRIKEWSGASYDEMIFFDSDSSSKEVHDQLGVRFAKVSKSKGLNWETYKNALNGTPSPNDDSYDTPFWKAFLHWPNFHSHRETPDSQPRVGKTLGSGKFATAYDSPDDDKAVIKVLKYWTKESRHRFLEIYNIIKNGRPFVPDANNNDEQYVYMLALEIRNLGIVNQLKAPKPEQFTGWFTITKIQGIPLWKTPLYRKHPFSVTFQQLVKTAFHLAIDEIENYVKKYGVEHRDAHLANAYFDMRGGQPVKAYLLDWGIAVLMQWDGERYVRGQDHLVWQDSGAGEKYTPDEFRRYWITWMVKTEYEANMKRGSITEKDGREFLKDIEWWFQR